MTWTSMTQNPEGLVSVYQGTVPPLVGVRIHAVSLDRDGPRLGLRFDLPEYPAVAPKKWQVHGYDTVQVELVFGGLRDVELRGFSTQLSGDIDLVRGEALTVSVSTDSMRLSAVAESAYIAKMSAYLNGTARTASGGSEG
ncbi:Imm50 family immunity protein [Streptomyces sp. NPDC005865]|uniref:Imm50 family immunity protein n=1 Tax=Streptomyces sp. NPDC005865 TaxID=3155453 RepID=UPI0033E99A5D